MHLARSGENDFRVIIAEHTAGRIFATLRSGRRHVWLWTVTGPYPDHYQGGPKVHHAKSTRLKTLVSRGIDRFVYEYDFGDYWLHDILIEECGDGLPDRDYPFFISGEGRCPPEDVGGVSGFEEFLEAVGKPRHPEHKRMIEWYGKPYDPADIDERRIRRLIEDMAARRRGPLMSHRKGGRTPPQ